MKIAHIIPADDMLASFRYRVAIPGAALTRLGHEVMVTDRAETGAVHVFHKHFEPERDLRLMHEVGGVFDICNDHFDDEHGDHYREMAYAASAITCSTQVLAQRIQAQTGQVAHVIPDPWEFPEAPHTWRGGHAVLWYGHPMNFAALKDVEFDCPFELVTACAQPISKVNVRMLPWSHAQMLESFARNDVVVIPQLKTLDAQGRGNNRAVNALRQGRFVVASPHPALEDLQDYIYQADIMLEGILWAREHPKNVAAMVAAGQHYVERAYHPDRIALMWLEAFNHTEEARAA